MHRVAGAVLAPERAHAALAGTGWPAERVVARTLALAHARGGTYVTDDALAMIAAPQIDIVIDATGSPAAGIAHVLACCEQRKDIVMVNVEADALAGPLLARRAPGLRKVHGAELAGAHEHDAHGIAARGPVLQESMEIHSGSPHYSCNRRGRIWRRTA
jgi:predicted homoserine dehydrogenase-like protein